MTIDNTARQPSLFDDITDPLNADDLPLAAYTDIDLEKLVATWRKNIGL